MGLTSHERRELAAIEAALMTEDPRMALELARMGQHLAARKTRELMLPLSVGVAGLAILALGAFTGATLLLLAGVFLTLIGPVVLMVAHHWNRSRVPACLVAGRQAV